MLEDIGQIPKVKRAIERGMRLVGYICNHSVVLNTMRKFTNKTELSQAWSYKICYHVPYLTKFAQTKG